jgi:hypothetical protein
MPRSKSPAWIPSIIADLRQGRRRHESSAPPLPARPLAERLAAYANSLRYEDLDAATIERVKTHLIDTLGCGIAVSSAIRPVDRARLLSDRPISHSR